MRCAGVGTLVDICLVTRAQVVQLCRSHVGIAEEGLPDRYTERGQEEEEEETAPICYFGQANLSL